MTIPDDALAGAVSAIVVALIYLARSLSKLSERVARLEGREDARDKG